MIDNAPATLIGRTVRFSGAVVRLIAASLLSAMLAGCSPTALMKQDDRATTPAATAFDATGKAWRKVSFRIRRDPSGEPDWHVDALLADQVLAPIIAHTESRIALWRFHRRAARDAAGHRFSLLFYSDLDTAQTINNGVAQSLAAKLLRADGLLVETGLADLSGAAEAALEATSDASWPDAIQQSWPWFAMGVSQSWLRLISEVRTTRPLTDGASAAELIGYYRGIHDEVSALWRDHGQHAYLHHLNALFGYQPLIIRETNLKRF